MFFSRHSIHKHISVVLRSFFLVACYATLHPALSVRPSVRRSAVGPSVGPSHFTFSAFMGFLAIPLLPKYSTDLKYGPCPPARDWGSRVSGLVFPKIVVVLRYVLDCQGGFFDSTKSLICIYVIQILGT